MIRLVIISAAALVAAAGGACAETPLERGDYLVNAFMACDGCHTPRPGGEFNMAKRFSGGTQVWDEKAYTVRGSNITPDRETGIGAWSADDLKRVLTEGVRPSGVHLAPQMPFVFYRILTPRDLDAVVAYLGAAAPIDNKVPPPVYKAETHAVPIPDAQAQWADEALHDPLKRGFYLSTISHCMECHSRRPDGTQDYANWYGKGGFEFTGPFGSVAARNITSHPTKGLGGWTDAEIKRALTHGVGRDGRAFKPPMARQIYFSKATDDDLDALVAWVRSIPPLE